MKNSVKIAALASVVAFLAFVNPFNYQEREAMILTGVMKFMDQVHYNPETMNDELSAVIFDEYVESLDSRKRFLTQDEVDELSQYRDKIDDQIKIKTFEMFEMSNTLIENGIKRGQEIYASIDVANLDLNGNEEVDLDYENRDRPKNEKELKKYWEQLIKYDLISKVESKIDKQEKKLKAMSESKAEETEEEKKEPYVEKTREEMIAEAIEDHTENYEKWFKRLNQQRRSDRFERKGTVITLTLRKKDGSEIILPIERDEVITEETLAKSLILDKVGSIENIGYIKLPKFYSSFEKEGGNSCAKDVASEIEKLKEVNVNGIILDLRNNTGGSLQDVVEMSGLFIEEGPIVQVKPRTRDAYVHKDKNPDVLYDGPLMILVNKYSASASEIIAAAMQDYKRAVIVGSTSTYGKGTVQRFYDLDRAFKGGEESR